MKRAGFARKVYRPASVPVTPSTSGCRAVIAPRDAANAVPKDAPVRSEPYRRFVAEQECFLCRVVGFSQCAHENVGKGMAMKVCDSRTFPACGPHWGMPGCHYLFDNLVDITRGQAREIGAKCSAEMRARAAASGWCVETLRRIK